MTLRKLKQQLKFSKASNHIWGDGQVGSNNIYLHKGASYDIVWGKVNYFNMEYVGDGIKGNDFDNVNLINVHKYICKGGVYKYKIKIYKGTGNENVLYVISIFINKNSIKYIINYKICTWVGGGLLTYLYVRYVRCLKNVCKGNDKEISKIKIRSLTWSMLKQRNVMICMVSDNKGSVCIIQIMLIMLICGVLLNIAQYITLAKGKKYG